MIVTEARSSTVETNLGTVATRFKIKASARAFKILSGFYSDPVAAIPRELGANAWDSHVKAKNLVPFEVHAPNMFEPWFAIRDFGTGLSAEDIENIYTTYFESTKTADNDSDGCMGLGSKTPFNYTENFTVTAWFDGVKRVYSCFIDEAGSPNILLMAAEASTEHAGIEVKFAVKAADISTFINKIRQAYSPFRVKPIIKGVANIQYREMGYIQRGTNWALPDRTCDCNYRNGCRAFMGNYIYPIDSNNLLYGSVKGADTKTVEEGRRVIRSGAFDLFFNIGDLSVAPNKEQLQYDADERTILAILTTASIAYTAIVDIVQSQIEKPTSLWHAAQLYQKYNSIGSEWTILRDVIGAIAITYNGVSVSSDSLSVDTAFDGVDKLIFETDPATGRRTRQFAVQELSVRSNGNQRILNTGHFRPSSESPVIFHTSELNIKHARIRHKLEKLFPNGKYPRVYIISDYSTANAALKKYQAELGWDPAWLHHIESLPRYPVTPRSVTSLVHPEGILTMKTANVACHFSTRAFTADSAKTYYYIPHCNSTAMMNDVTTIDASRVCDVVEYAVGAGLIKVDTVPEIYGLNKKDRKFLKVGTWINVFDIVRDHLANPSVVNKIEQQLYNQDAWKATHLELATFEDFMRRLNSKTAFADGLVAEDCKKLVKEIIAYQSKKSYDVDSSVVSVAAVYKITPKCHGAAVLTVESIRNLLDVRWHHFFDIIDRYSATVDNVLAILNAFEKKN